MGPPTECLCLVSASCEEGSSQEVSDHCGAERLEIERTEKTEKMKPNKDYPEAPITIIDIPLWSDEEQDDYISGRIKLHQDAEFERLTGGSLPPCSDLERWARPTTYAVKKTKNKRAMAVFNSMEEAEFYFNNNQLDDKHCIEERPGKSVRCEGDYCGVSQFCDQFEAIRNGDI